MGPVILFTSFAYSALWVASNQLKNFIYSKSDKCFSFLKMNLESFTDYMLPMLITFEAEVEDHCNLKVLEVTNLSNQSDLRSSSVVLGSPVSSV